MPELREETASIDRIDGRGRQGIRLVQDGQPPRGQEREQIRDEGRDQVREQVRNEAGREVRGQGEARGQELSEERGVILARAVARGRAVIVSFAADDCPFLAGAVAYQIFFALIPLLALLVGILACGSSRLSRAFSPASSFSSSCTASSRATGLRGERRRRAHWYRPCCGRSPSWRSATSRERSPCSRRTGRSRSRQGFLPGSTSQRSSSCSARRS